MITSSLTEKQQYWLQHIKQADAFKGSLVDYAKRHQLNEKDLYSWRSQLRKHGIIQPPEQKTDTRKAPRFTKVIAEQPAGLTFQCRIGPLTLTCSELPDPAWLATLAKQMEPRS